MAAMRSAAAVRSVQTMADRLGAPSVGGHRELGEGAGGQEVLERDAVVRPLVGDGADDAALAVGGAGDADAGLRRGGGSCGPRRRRRGGRVRVGPSATAIVAPVRVRRDGRPRRGRRGGGSGSRVQGGVEGDAQAAGLDHPAEGLGLGGGAAGWSKCRCSGEARRPTRPSETRMSRMGPEGCGRASHRPAASSRRARAGGDGVGAAVEIRVFHGGQRRRGR